MKTIKNFRNLLIMGVLILSVQPSNAQFWEKLKKKVSDAAERTVLNEAERKTQQKTSKTIDGVFEGDSERSDKKQSRKERRRAKRNRKSSGAIIDNRTSTGNQYNQHTSDNDEIISRVNSNSNQTFFFNKSLVMEVRGKAEGRDYKSTIEYFFNTSNPNIMAMEMQMEKPKGYEEYDMPNDLSTTFLINADETSMIMGSGEDKVRMKINRNQLKNVDLEKWYKPENVRKTGRKEYILGFLCDEYAYKDKDGTALIWVSQKPIINLSGIANIFEGIRNKAFGDGMMLKGEFTSKEGTMYLEAKRFGSTSKTINEGDY